MKILVISPSFLPAVGGAEIVMLEVFRRLSLRHKVRLVTILPEEKRKIYFSDEHNSRINFEVIRFQDKLNLAKLHGNRISFGIIPPFSLSAVRAVKENMKEFRPDVINLHYVVPTGLAAAIGKLSFGTPLVVTFNGRDVPGPRIPFFWKYWDRLTASFADEVTFVSKFCRDAVFGQKSQKGFVIYNGVNLPEEPLSDRAYEKRRLGIKENEKMIFSLGRLDKIKKVDILIKTMCLLKKKYPNLVLYIAGKGPEGPSLQDLVRKLDLQGSVRLLGYVPSDQLDSYFAASEFFVFHSRFETFGVVLAEAMSRGRACVACDSTAIPEVAPEGECALLARTMDAGDMAKKISRLLEDEELRHRLEENGKKRARELFDWEKIAAKYENVFSKIVNVHENPLHS